MNSSFQYFKTIWVTSEERFWFKSANPFRISKNQGVEGLNQDIKQSQTFRKRLSIGSFIDVQLRMCQEWSLSDSSLLEANREKHLFAQPHGLRPPVTVLHSTFVSSTPEVENHDETPEYHLCSLH